MASSSNFDLTYNKLDVVAGGALSNATATTGTSTGSGVTKIISSGSNVSVSPSSGVGDVTISVTAGGSGTVSEVKGTGTVQGITLTGDVTTSGYLTLGGSLSAVDLTSQVTGTLPVGKGGTGATTLSGVLKGNTTSAISAASGSDLNSTFGTQTAKSFYAGPTSGADANPSFRAIAASDVPTLNQNTTGNAATVTGLSVASGKTLTANNTLTLSGTDGSTLAIGGGGTLGSAAYTPTSQYVAASSGSAANLTLTGTLTADSSVGTSGYFLQTTGTGVKWAAASGSSGVSSIIGTSGITPATLTTGAVSLGLAAITPASVNGITLSGSGTPTLSVTGASSISGSSSGTNTGDQTNITGTAGNVTGTVTTTHGGTGLTTTPTDGQLLIGNSTTSGYTLANITGSGTVSVTNGHGTIAIAGSGFSNPMSALGDTIYGGSSPAGTPTRLAGNTAGVVKYLAQSGTGSVSSSPAWLQSYVYNVKDYGCVGNWDPIAGTGSDDTSAFQNCITAALSAASAASGTSQATVYIPAGSYKVTSDLIASGTTFSGNIAFKGDGWKVSKIIYTGTGTCLNLQASTSGYTYKNTVTVSGIGFIADNTSAASCALNVFYTTSTVPNSSAGEDSPIVSLSDIAVGVVITGEYAYHIANAGFINGIKLHNVCQSHVTNLYLMGNTTHYGSASSVGAGDGGAGSGRGLWCTGTINIMYMNIDVRFWGQAIYLDSTSDASSQGNFFTNVNGVSNCEFFTTYAASGLQQVFAFNLVNFQSDNGASDTGVANPSYVRGVVINSLAYGSSISNGLILISVPVGGVSFGKPAILINGAQQVFISNVKAYDASNATSAYYGCYITGASSYVNISNCFLQGGGSSVGLYIDSGCNNNTAVGNSLINGYSDNGSGNQIGYNAS